MLVGLVVLFHRVLLGEGEKKGGAVPGKPKGGGGKPWPGRGGGPPEGLSMGFEPAWPSAA